MLMTTFHALWKYPKKLDFLKFSWAIERNIGIFARRKTVASMKFKHVTANSMSLRGIFRIVVNIYSKVFRTKFNYIYLTGP